MRIFLATSAIIVAMGAVVLMLPNVGWFWRAASVLGWSEVSVCACPADEDVRFRRDDGLVIAASIYRSDQRADKPGLVLVHGNTPVGRQLPLYKVLATKLAARGYVVLAIDMAGYGESGDPFQLGVLEAIANEGEVHSAIEYVAALPDVDSDRIHVLGHSAGVTPVLAAGIADSAVKKIVAIGPPRRLSERLLQEDDREYFWRRANRNQVDVYGRPFPSWFTKDVWLQWNLSRDISRHLSYFSDPAHKPILLIDGELEGAANKRYLQDYYDRISPPKHYETIANSDHYANTRAVWRWSLYDDAVVSATVGLIDSWLKQ